MSGSISRKHFVRIVSLALGLFASLVLFSDLAAGSETTHEVYRIRLINAEGGPIEVSTDAGLTYRRVGTVTRGTTSVIRGYAASIYGVPGTVCATAVHGIRIKVGGAKDCPRQESRVISIIPSEFTSVPKGFGGHVAGESGIYTDVHAGTAIFRNLSPLVGNPVFRENGDRLIPLEDGYTPVRGDVLVIRVEVPDRYPSEIEFENKYDGKVEAVYSDGKREAIAKVIRPVRGIGRFDATGYTGVGRVNTNHTGVVTISTAPMASGEKDGSGTETRGGFMIQPSRHAKSAGEYWQVMVVGPTTEKPSWLEGMSPLFSGYLGLAWYPSDQEHSFQVRVKTTSSGWIELPTMVGLNDSALMHLPNGKGAVTGIQIQMPHFSDSLSAHELLQCSAKYEENRRCEALKNGTVVKDGEVTIGLDPSRISGVQTVNLYVDGIFRGVSNTPPYSFSLDSKTFEDGEHSASLSGVDSHGATICRSVHRFYIIKSKGS